METYFFVRQDWVLLFATLLLFDQSPAQSGGISWEATSLNTAEVRDLTTLKGNIIFAATNVGLYKTTDEGNTWINNSDTAMGSDIWCAYASADDKVWAGAKSGLFVSSDSGDTWLFRYTSDTLSWVRDAVMSNGKLFISVMDSSGGSARTVLLSTDTGNTWIKADSGIIGYSRVVFFFSDTSGTVYGLAGEGAITYDILYKWDGVQGLWTPVFNFSPAFLINQVKVSSGNIFFAATTDGMIASDDSGTTWIPKDLYPNTCITLDILPADTIIVGTNRNGVFQTDDLGTNWVQHANGLPPNPLSPIVKDPISALCHTSDTRLFAGTRDSGIYRSARLYNVLHSTTPEKTITIGPNPANNELQITGLSQEPNLIIEIKSSIGQVVYQNRFVNQNEGDYVSVSLVSMTSGVYFCSMFGPRTSMVSQILVLK